MQTIILRTRGIAATSVLAALALLLCARPASAEHRSLHIVNYSPWPIVEVYIGFTLSGFDMAYAGSRLHLAPGGTAVIALPDTAMADDAKQVDVSTICSAQVFDVTFANGSTMRRPFSDVCEYPYEAVLSTEIRPSTDPLGLRGLPIATPAAVQQPPSTPRSPVPGAALRGQSKLVAAVLTNNLMQVQKLLNDGGSPDEETRPQRVPLLAIAAESGNFKMVRLLLSAGAKTQAALGYEIGQKRLDAVRTLVDSGMNVDERYISKYGTDTPLIIATKAQDVPMMVFLLLRGADPNARMGDGSNMITALMWAAYYCNSDTIKVLKDHGALDSYMSAQGTAAMLAQNGWTDTMKPCNSDVLTLIATT